jgi:A/G-specific adenine glycosylase
LSTFPALNLLDWYHQVKRPLKWRDTSDPYVIWVSEIMLQQTRVQQAAPYFERFIQTFPDIYSLANADQQEVLKLWEGLGYYSRARNLHQGAKDVVRLYDGRLPEDKEKLLSIKGIGTYTASAILSIAFNKPYGVLDGNVIRVLSRYLNITDFVTKSEVKLQLQKYSDSIVETSNPGDFNQALMELGATVCTPKKPKCDVCPLLGLCINAKSVTVERIPYKPKKSPIPHHNVVVGIIRNPIDFTILIAKRKQHVMLGGLWEFPGGKVACGESLEEALHRELQEELKIKVHNLSKLTSLKHTYSHFKITLHAYYCDILHGDPTPMTSEELKWVPKKDLHSFPFPQANKLILPLIDF